MQYLYIQKRNQVLYKETYPFLWFFDSPIEFYNFILDILENINYNIHYRSLKFDVYSFRFITFRHSGRGVFLFYIYHMIKGHIQNQFLSKKTQNFAEMVTECLCVVFERSLKNSFSVLTKKLSFNGGKSLYYSTLVYILISFFKL